MANLTAHKQVIYTAEKSETVNVIFTNKTLASCKLNCASTQKTFNDNDSMAPEAFTEWPIDLEAGENIFAWGDEKITYQVLIDGKEIKTAAVLAPVEPTVKELLQKIGELELKLGEVESKADTALEQSKPK